MKALLPKAPNVVTNFNFPELQNNGKLLRAPVLF